VTIKSLIERIAQDVIDIGQKLIEAKEQLEHGQFGDWLRTEFNWGSGQLGSSCSLPKKGDCIHLS